MIKLTPLQKVSIIQWLTKLNDEKRLINMRLNEVVPVCRRELGLDVRPRIMRYIIKGCNFQYKQSHKVKTANSEAPATKSETPKVTTYRPNGTAYLRIAKLENDFISMARRLHEIDGKYAGLVTQVAKLTEENTKLRGDINEMMEAMTRPSSNDTQDKLEPELRAWLEKESTN